MFVGKDQGYGFVIHDLVATKPERRRQRIAYRVFEIVAHVCILLKWPAHNAQAYVDK